MKVNKEMGRCMAIAYMAVRGFMKGVEKKLQLMWEKIG